MALQWLWKNKCGEATFRRTIAKGDPTKDGTYEIKDFTVNLYEGNAELIFIYEYELDGRQMYNLIDFFADKDHMKRCLGLDKKDKETYGNNTYEHEYNKLVKIRFNKAKSRNYKEIITAFVQAFKEIEIEVYTKEEEANE